MSAKLPVKSAKKRPNRSFIDVVIDVSKSHLPGSFRAGSLRRVAHDFSKVPSRTEQSHKDSCSMKLIVEKHLGKDIHPMMFVAPAATWNTGNGELPSFHDAQNYIAEMHSQFHALPARSRAFFENDPALYFQFCSDPANRDHMEKLGINTDHFPQKLISEGLVPKQAANAAPEAKAPAGDLDKPQA